MVQEILEKHKIKFISQYKNVWLGKQSLDFYLPEYNIAIECQGEQHFQKTYRNQNLIQWKSKLQRDIKKKEICESNNIKLYYFISPLIEKRYSVINNNEYKIYNLNNSFIDVQTLLKEILH
jgi:hypothetical protein